LEDVRLYAQRHVQIFLLGNKVDLLDERKIEFKDAKAYAEKYHMQYFEVNKKKLIIQN
jgi:hypothetical protein